MKDLGKLKFCFSLQIEYLWNGISGYLLAYIESHKALSWEQNSLNSLMVVFLLEVNKYMLYSKEENEKVLGLEIPYLKIIGILMYLANCTQSQ